MSDGYTLCPWKTKQGMDDRLHFISGGCDGAPPIGVAEVYSPDDAALIVATHNAFVGAEDVALRVGPRFVRELLEALTVLRDRYQSEGNKSAAAEALGRLLAQAKGGGSDG